MRIRAVRWLSVPAVALTCSLAGAPASPAATAVTAYATTPVFTPSAPVTGGPSTTVGTNVNITNKPGAQSETTVAIDPTNTSHLLAASNDLSGIGALGMYESNDAGATWHFAGFNPNGFCYDPWIDFNRKGDAFLSYECSDERIAYRKHGTTTWVATTFTIAGGNPDRDMVVVDTYSPKQSKYSGSVYVGYDDNGQNNTAYVLYSRDGFSNWQRSPRINDNGSPTISVHVSVGPKGVLYATWEGYSNEEVWIDRSTDGGATWGQDHVVHTYRLPTDSFEEHIPPQPKRGTVPFPFNVTAKKGTAHAGRVYVSYPDLPAGAEGGPGYTNIYVTHSDDGGVTWSPEKAVTDGLPAAWRFMQSIAITPEGTVGVTFYDTRQDPVAGVLVDRYVTFSTDGGDTWSANQRVTSASSTEVKGTDLNEYGDYQGLDAARGNLFYAVWTDSRTPGAQAEDMFGSGVTP